MNFSKLHLTIFMVLSVLSGVTYGVEERENLDPSTHASCSGKAIHQEQGINEEANNAQDGHLSTAGDNIQENKDTEGEKEKEIHNNTILTDVKSVVWENKGLLNHTIGDGLTVMARLVFDNPIMELCESSYRWLSGGYMWYETHQQRQANPSLLMDVKEYAVWGHLGADALDVVLTYSPLLLESIPGGEYVKGGVATVQGLTFATIFAVTAIKTYHNIKAQGIKAKKAG